MAALTLTSESHVPSALRCTDADVSVPASPVDMDGSSNAILEDAERFYLTKTKYAALTLGSGSAEALNSFKGIIYNYMTSTDRTPLTEDDGIDETSDFNRKIIVNLTGVPPMLCRCQPCG